ncbi:hypothetical protein [Streptomyces sp. NPDC005167]
MFGVAEEDIGEGIEVLGFRCCQVVGEGVGGVVDVGAGGFDEAGGPFPPGLIFCPWTSEIVREVPAP